MFSRAFGSLPKGRTSATATPALPALSAVTIASRDPATTRSSSSRKYRYSPLACAASSLRQQRARSLCWLSVFPIVYTFVVECPDGRFRRPLRRIVANQHLPFNAFDFLHTGDGLRQKGFPSECGGRSSKRSCRCFQVEQVGDRRAEAGRLEIRPAATRTNCWQGRTSDDPIAPFDAASPACGLGLCVDAGSQRHYTTCQP